ncbi:MAG: ATP-binding protein [Burkholderiaceae bacterium]|nr:ATP-binding protein [Burkholderiaceae bacterium]
MPSRSPSPSPSPLPPELTTWITEAALQHPDDLPAHLAQRLGVDLRSGQAFCRQLRALQWLRREGSSRRPRWHPGPLRQVVRRYALDGLQEDRAWRQHFAPAFELPPNVAEIAEQVFTELVNNAVDHSGGSLVTVSMRQTPWQCQLLVSDDGRGVFDSLGQRFQLDDPAQAMLQLALGKLSSQPERHTGRGLFFTARLADVFDLHANGAAFQQRDWQRSQWHAGRPACQHGTSVYVALRLDTQRTLDEVLRQHSLDGQGYAFERTVLPLRLAGGLSSRAQARRVAERLPLFRRVELDFDGLPSVGHAFADELLRVFGRAHPQVELVPVNAAPSVAALLRSVVA